MNENKTNINRKISIFRKVGSNYWKYSLFDFEIFTYVYNLY